MEKCPNPDPNCKYYQHDPDNCVLTNHHIYYPRTDYAEPIARRFRNMAENQIMIPRCEHDVIHHSGEVPIKPSLEIMKQCLKAENERRQRGKQEVERPSP